MQTPNSFLIFWEGLQTDLGFPHFKFVRNWSEILDLNISDDTLIVESPFYRMRSGAENNEVETNITIATPIHPTADIEHKNNESNRLFTRMTDFLQFLEGHYCDDLAIDFKINTAAQEVDNLGNANMLGWRCEVKFILR